VLVNSNPATVMTDPGMADFTYIEPLTVCFIENIGPMGVHTGDSFCSAPMLTISPELQKRLQDYSYKIVEAMQVIGGTNIQFAHDPATGRVVVIEINPRTSRSSALASKATGFPIAFISAKLAGGYTLKDIPCWREEALDKYTPWGDYVVIKFARWTFEKFRGAEDKLGTQMKAVGEVADKGDRASLRERKGQGGDGRCGQVPERDGLQAPGDQGDKEVSVRTRDQIHLNQKGP
jgi:carbamoylphosphate synthase large subunit